MNQLLLLLTALFSFTLTISNVKAQTEWPKIIGSNYYNVTPVSVRECYDKGYLVHYKYQVSQSSQSQTALMKTDVNGTTLWTKTFGSNSNSVTILGADETPDGGLILYGQSSHIANGPFVMKLNACMEKEWCKTDTANDAFSMNAITLPDGTFIFHRTEVHASVNHIITKLDNSGKTLWSNQYTNSNPEYDAGSMWVTYNKADNTLIMRGCVGMNVPPDSLGQSRPYISKISTDGEALWEFYTIPGITYINTICTGFEIAMHPTGTYTLPVQRPFETSELLNVDKDGHFLSINTIAFPDSILTPINSMEALNTGNILFSIQRFSNTGLPVNASILVTDTLGNILTESVIDDNEPLLVFDIATTTDNKILTLNSLSDGGFSFIKLDSNLLNDTIYAENGDYDTRCDHTIQSSTITIDCSTYGIDESPLKLSLKISPNPTSDYLIIQLPDMIAVSENQGLFSVKHFESNYVKNLTCEIFDINGKSVYEISLPDNTYKHELDIRNLTRGIYLIKICRGNSVTGQAKFVIY